MLFNRASGLFAGLIVGGLPPVRTPTVCTSGDVVWYTDPARRDVCRRAYTSYVLDYYIIVCPD